MMLYYNTVCYMTNTRTYITRKHNEKRFLLLRGSCGNWLQLIGLWFVRIRERLVGLLGNHLFTCPNQVPRLENERQLSTGLSLITHANKYYLRLQCMPERSQRGEASLVQKSLYISKQKNIII